MPPHLASLSPSISSSGRRELKCTLCDAVGRTDMLLLFRGRIATLAAVLFSGISEHINNSLLAGLEVWGAHVGLGDGERLFCGDLGRSTERSFNSWLSIRNERCGCHFGVRLLPYSIRPQAVCDLRWVLTSATCRFRSDKPSRTAGDWNQQWECPSPTDNGSGQ